MVDFNNPAFQRLAQRRMSQEVWGGIKGFAPEVRQFAADEAKRGVQMGDYYLRKRGQEAQMEQMKFEQGMAERRLGLDTGYLGLESRNLGFKERNLSIAEQVQNQRQAQMSWEHNWKNKELKSKEKELNLSTMLGLGTAAWSAYEGNRRSNVLAEDRRIQREFNEEIKNSMVTTEEFKRKMREKGYWQ